MTVASNYPTIKPSLLLDFANSKRLDSRITFTRASTATYYDGVTTSKAEENLATHSQAFNNWNGASTSILADQTTSPDGSATADLLSETSSAAAHWIEPGVSEYVSVSGSGITYTASLFVKKGPGATAPDIVQLTLFSSAFGVGQYANFNISVGGGSSGTVTASSGGTASIIFCGDGWYRISWTATSTGAGNLGIVLAFVNNNPTAGRLPSYAGNTTSNVYVWGAQLEQRSFSTVYIPTTTQPITTYQPTLLSAANNVPRFHHDPVTEESLGLLIEEQRTNICTNSSTFSSWSNRSLQKVLSTTIVPDGTNSGIEVSRVAPNNMYFLFSTTVGTTYTVSIYAKKSLGNQLAFGIESVGFGTNGVHTFDLSNGTVNTRAGFTATILNVGNGWYRCIVSGTATSATSSAAIQVAPSVEFRSICVWGGQLETGSFATSYISTSGASATRLADTAAITGTNFSSWYSQDEGTIVVDTLTGIQNPTASPTFAVKPIVCFLGNSPYTSYMYVRRRTQTNGAYNVVSKTMNTTYFDIRGGNISDNSASKYAFAYSYNDVVLYGNGASVGTDAAAPIPTIYLMRIGTELGTDGSVSALNGTIRNIAYYPARLTNQQLQGLTT